MADNKKNENESKDIKLFEDIVKIINENRVLKKKVMDRIYESKARVNRVPGSPLGIELKSAGPGKEKKAS